MSYIGSSFFDYDYKFENDQKYNADGSINKDAIVAGAYTTNYSAATKLEDVTSTVDAKWGYTAAQKEEGGYAWKITLRDDLKWDDGTPIKAADFVYSMQQQLDPAFMNFRANTYYDTLKIKNSKVYFFQNQEGTYEGVASQGYESNAAAIAAGKVIYINVYDFWGAEGYVDAQGNACPQWVAYNDETVYDTAAAWAAGAAADAFSGKAIWDAYGAAYLEVGAGYESCAAVYVENLVRDVAWDTVGIYSIDDENAIVVCLDKSFSFLHEDGSLSYLAAYYMSGLPLVHKEKYEAAKVAPADGATLWTSKYNSSLETTASWGPYKLAEFEAGSYYKLVKNENWYGYGMEQYKNQYNVTSVYCRKVEEWATRWNGFLAGEYDDASLQTENVGEYADSKYVYYTSTATGTFGMQLYSNLSVLKNSENNNGILAIDEFRQAFNLGLNRSDIVEKIWPGTAIPCFGLINVAYYYDIENAPNLADGGQYRNTAIAKAGVLRAYGFTQGEDGKWSSGELTNLELDEAYDALTGYNPTLAKEKMKEAADKLVANAEEYGYDATKDITIVYGSSVDNDKQRFRADYIQGILDDLTKGTAIEGKIKIKFDASAGSKWAEAFRTGKTQIGFGYGFSGNAFNPFDIVGAFVNPDDNLNYHTYWDTSAIDMTLTLPAGDYEGAGQTITMSVQNWFFCLNGLAETENQAKKYNWDAGKAPVEVRLTILSALEELTIKESRSVMLIAESGGSFLGAKFSYFSDEENVFMGFGGMRYIEVNYTDEEWSAYVASNNNDLAAEYKKSE
ncbi:MAG: ABC transporter substrate-binding protein, partial [Eubacteriales bacterium]